MSIGYHKIPGGGIEEGESAREGLRREINEEVGSEIRILGEVGEIIKYRSRQSLKHNSVCFVAKEESSGEPDFTKKEMSE